MGSLLLILIAIALLVLGLASGSSGLLISSIGASLLAAVALVVGARQAAALRIEVDGTDRAGFPPTASGRRPSRLSTAETFPGPAGPGPEEVDAGADTDFYRRPDPSVGSDRFPGAGRSADPEPFSDPDAFGDPDPVRDADRLGPDPFDGSDPLRAPGSARRPDPFADVDPDLPAAEEHLRSDPFTRPDPFVEPMRPAEVTVPTQGGEPEDEARWRHPAGPYRRTARGGEGLGVDGDEFAVVDIPPDEPDAQQVPAATAARVATLSTEVMVIDGRPRYHLATCPHLVGRESEPLPVGEAVELGFTPCGRCAPDDHLLADPGRV